MLLVAHAGKIPQIHILIIKAPTLPHCRYARCPPSHIRMITARIAYIKSTTSDTPVRNSFKQPRSNLSGPSIRTTPHVDPRPSLQNPSLAQDVCEKKRCIPFRKYTGCIGPEPRILYRGPDSYPYSGFLLKGSIRITITERYKGA